VLTNFVVKDFDNVPTVSGGDINQPGFFADQYGDQNFLIEHFLLDTLDHGPLVKGTAVGGTVFNYGTIRYGIIRNVSGCIQLADLHATNVTTIQYVLCHDWVNWGISLDLTAGDNLRNVLIEYSTVADGSCPDANCGGPIYMGESMTGTNITIRNNILDWVNATHGHAIYGELYSGTVATSNYNGFYRAGNTLRWSHNGASYTTLTGVGSWNAATGQDANSTVLASDPFVNRAGSVFTVSVGHAAKTASSTGGEIGAYATAETIGPITQ